MKKIISLIIFVSTLNNLYSWDTAAAKYLPLQIGNVWVYRSYSYTINHCDCYEKYTITGTSLINGRIYFQFQRMTNQFIYNSSNCGSNFFVGSRLLRNNYIRIDSVSLNIYSLDTCLIDSLAAKESDSVVVCNGYSPVACDTSIQNIFGLYKPSKLFVWSNFEAYELMWYIKDFGLVRYHLHQPGPTDKDMLLMGCIINGAIYGDTNTLVGVNQGNSEIPKNFSLSQNYPNPFNPTTKIRFVAPLDSRLRGNDKVVLKVYDVLGREIQTLVNEELSPGVYEVEFDGSNLPSGVYYYKLIVSREQLIQLYKETRKMVLIR